MKIRQARKIVKNYFNIEVFPKNKSITTALNVFGHHNRGREGLATIGLITMSRDARKLCSTFIKYTDAISRASRMLTVYSQISNEALSA